MTDLERLSALHGLAQADIEAIGVAWAADRGLLTPNDLAEGLASVVATYLQVLNETPGEFPREHQPTAQIVIDRAAELLLARLQQAGRSGQVN